MKNYIFFLLSYEMDPTIFKNYKPEEYATALIAEIEFQIFDLAIQDKTNENFFKENLNFLEQI